MKKVMIIAAHPDDEVVGCGGTMARLAREGFDVHLMILGEGITSRYRQRQDADIGLIEKLNKDVEKVANLLEASDFSMHNLPDNRFDTKPLLEIVKIIENEINSIKPEIVFTHHGGDLNIDHKVVNRAVLTATRPLTGQPVKEIYAFEVASSTEWAFQKFEPVFRANYFVDISLTLEIKKRAITLYESEVRKFPHPRSPEALEVIARRWGSVVGLQAAEAFELIRSIR